MDATWNLSGVPHGMIHVVYLCEWLTLSHVSKEGNKRKRKKLRKKIKKKNVRRTSGKGGKWWEVSPTLINSGMRIKREKEEKKREKKGRKKMDKEREEMRRKENGDFSGRSTVES